MNSAPELASCPACKTLNVREHFECETLLFGEDASEIIVNVPVLTCDECGFAYTDERAERARHAAVCSFKKLLSPEEIAHVRKTVLGMSREAFHAAYGLSSASVERWENGKLFQNEAADTLIRALRDPALARQLDRRMMNAETSPNMQREGNVIWGKFPSLEKAPKLAEDALQRSRNFNLRIQAL